MGGRADGGAADPGEGVKTEQQIPKPDRAIIQWLLDSDPSIHWQVMRDLTGAPAEEVAAERARVATEGMGARLLALQGADGRWGGAAWNRGWNSTMHVLMLLRDLGLDPASGEARRALGLEAAQQCWGEPFPLVGVDDSCMLCAEPDRILNRVSLSTRVAAGSPGTLFRGAIDV